MSGVRDLLLIDVFDPTVNVYDEPPVDPVVGQSFWLPDGGGMKGWWWALSESSRLLTEPDPHRPGGPWRIAEPVGTQRIVYVARPERIR